MYISLVPRPSFRFYIASANNYRPGTSCASSIMVRKNTRKFTEVSIIQDAHRNLSASQAVVDCAAARYSVPGQLGLAMNALK